MRQAMRAEGAEEPLSGPAAAARSERRPWPWARAFLSVDRAFVPVVLVALVLALSLASPYFFTATNLENILIEAAVLGITAVGATFLIICGELDLSIGSNVALSGVVAAMGMTSVSHSVAVGVAMGIATGVAIGIFNGLVTCVLRVASFISTLGMLVMSSGLALALTNGATIAGLPPAFASVANANVAGVRSLIWVMALTFVVGYLVLHRTSFGIKTFAVGGNAEAARLSGLPVNRIRFVNFVISGFTGGLGGVLLASRVQAGQPNIGTTLTLYATAAVILGGTSIRGGRGAVGRSLLGVLLIGVVQNGLDILGVNYAFQQAAVGAVFIVAASSEFLRWRTGS
jgi:ribose transport system permease protein